jgi:hypothetical protein
MDFTSILNRGIRRFIDKNLKKRKFGKCEACKIPTLLIEYVEPDDSTSVWILCERCYTAILDTEDEV